MIEQEGKPKKYKRKRKQSSETEDHQKQRLATLERLKQGDENELERKLRLEKAVASKHLRLAMETEEERRARMENGATYVYKYVTVPEKRFLVAQIMIFLYRRFSATTPKNNSWDKMFVFVS